MTDKLEHCLVKRVTPPPFCFIHKRDNIIFKLNVLTNFTELNLHLISIIFLLNN